MAFAPLPLELTRFGGDLTIWGGGIYYGQTYLLPEFRQQVIALAQAGRTPESLVRESEPSAQTIRNWVAQAAVLEPPHVAEAIQYRTLDRRGNLGSVEGGMRRPVAVT